MRGHHPIHDLRVCRRTTRSLARRGVRSDGGACPIITYRLENVHIHRLILSRLSTSIVDPSTRLRPVQAMDKPVDGGSRGALHDEYVHTRGIRRYRKVRAQAVADAPTDVPRGPDHDLARSRCVDGHARVLPRHCLQVQGARVNRVSDQGDRYVCRYRQMVSSMG